MERPSLHRDPKREKKHYSRWLVRHPEKMQNRSERRSILRELRRQMKSMRVGRRWRGRTGGWHKGSKKGTGTGAFGGRTLRARMHKIKQTCPDRVRRRR